MSTSLGQRLRLIPGEVVLLGLVSLLTDVSSEIIFGVLPIFLTGVLGASALLLGLMEGLADFAASSLDLASLLAADPPRETRVDRVSGPLEERGAVPLVSNDVITIAGWSTITSASSKVRMELSKPRVDLVEVG